MNLYLDNVSAWREELWRQEQQRVGPAQRPFWNPAAWVAALDTLAQAEQGRDVALLDAVNAAPPWSPELTRLDRVRYETLGEDVAWYARLEQQLVWAWSALAGVGAGSALAELEAHLDVVRARRAERRVRQAEAGLVRTERRRRADGFLQPGHWAADWASLEQAWREQNAALTPPPPPDPSAPPELHQQHLARLEWLARAADAVYPGRLAWLHELQAYQSDTAAMGHPAGRLDYAALQADHALVDAAVAALTPAAPAAAAGGEGGGGWFMLMLAIGFIVVLAASGGRGGQGSAAGQAPAGEVAAVAPTVPPALVEAEALLRAGDDLRADGYCAEALPRFEQAIALDPALADARALLGFCLYDLGRIDEAAARFEEALQINPGSAEAIAGLATARLRQGRPEEAGALYAQAVGLDPRYADEAFLRVERRWSGPTLLDSRPLRSGAAS